MQIFCETDRFRFCLVCSYRRKGNIQCARPIKFFGLTTFAEGQLSLLNVPLPRYFLHECKSLRIFATLCKGWDAKWTSLLPIFTGGSCAGQRGIILSPNPCDV